MNVQVDIASKMPSRKSRVYDMKARRSQRGGMLVMTAKGPANRICEPLIRDEHEETENREVG